MITESDNENYTVCYKGCSAYKPCFANEKCFYYLESIGLDCRETLVVKCVVPEKQFDI